MNFFRSVNFMLTIYRCWPGPAVIIARDLSSIRIGPHACCPSKVLLCVSSSSSVTLLPQRCVWILAGYWLLTYYDRDLIWPYTNKPVWPFDSKEVCVQRFYCYSRQMIWRRQLFDNWPHSCFLAFWKNIWPIVEMPLCWHLWPPPWGICLIMF